MGMVHRTCLRCAISFRVFPCRTKNGYGTYCSRTCARFHKPSRYWLGKKSPHLALYRRTHPSWNKGKKYEAISGEKHWNWKGGITEKSLSDRAGVEYKRWRQAVFERDGFRCVIGGKEHGNKLNADHIKSFSKHPDLRFELSNGRTLCKECHKKTDNYCGRAFAKIK